MGFVRLPIKHASQRAKSWFGLLSPVRLWLTLPGLIISVIILAQPPAGDNPAAGLIHHEQVSLFDCGQITFIQNAIDLRYYSFKLSESQKLVSESYRLGPMGLIYSHLQSGKGLWKISLVLISHARSIFLIPIYILGHALLN